MKGKNALMILETGWGVERMLKHLIFIFLISCSNYSNLSENLVKRGEFLLKGYVSEKGNVSETLSFNRLSWYQELTLISDVIYAHVPRESAFQNWFSESEKDLISQCDDFFVYLSYFLDSNKISHGDFRSQLNSQGYEELALPQFSQYFRMHPDYEKDSFHLYKIHGACKSGSRTKQLSLSYPGFHSQDLF